MRRFSIVASLVVLTLTVASSPVQRSHSQRTSSLSLKEFSKPWSPVRDLKRSRNIAGIDGPEDELVLDKRYADNSTQSIGSSDAEDILALDKRNTYNCTDLAADWDSRCWAQLDLTAYLTDPVTGWNITTRTCSVEESAVNNDGADCCKVGEAWTTCFLRLGHGAPGQDCSEINAQTCTYQSTLAANLPDAVKPKVQYMMKNIYGELMAAFRWMVQLICKLAVNDFFTTYYSALGAAQADAQTVIQALVNELDPVKATHFNLLYLLTALSVALAFLGAPSIAVTVLGLSLVTRTAAQVFTISLQQAPSTAKALWPSGTQNSQNVQVGNIESELGNSTNQLAGMINDAVELLMSDVPTFVHFCETGMWSGSTSLSLPSKVEGLDYALRTYMTSEVMSQNGWYAVPRVGPYESVNEVETGLGTGFDCQMGNNSVCTNSVGSAYYWSLATGTVYTLANKNGFQAPEVTPYQVLQDTVNNNWAILEVLFDGAFNCTLEGNFGNDLVNFNWDGTLNIACISQLPMTTMCGSPCPVPLVNNACPFNSTNDPCVSTTK